MEKTMATYKIAGVQMDITLGDRVQNLAVMKARLEQSLAVGAVLTVFPECTTTGYCFETKARWFLVLKYSFFESTNLTILKSTNLTILKGKHDKSFALKSKRLFCPACI